MTKIRIALLLLALGLFLPATLLVLRAVESLKLENAYRHEAVAERVFDEMERSLSDFLLREEPRPPSDYDRGLLEGGAGTVASSVFRAADEPFIVGWFAIDPGGGTRLYAPLASDASRITRAVGAALGARDPREDLRAAARPSVAQSDKDAPAPGRTKSTGKARLEKKELGAADEELLAESSAYDVLQNLNRAQSLRSERQDKARRKSVEQFADSSKPYASSPSSSRSPALDEMDSVQSRFGDSAAQTPQENSRQGLGVVAEAEGIVSADGAAEMGAAVDDSGSNLGRSRKRISDSSIDPLIGRLTQHGELVLTRSVWRDGRVERQGLVLDHAALVGWLRDRVLTETGLAERARVDFGTPDLPARDEAEHRYLHRFAEPFEGLVARLDLEPLAGVGSARPIYALALLLVLVGVTGIFSVDRMTRVVVEYAERRNNFVAAVSHELKTPLTAIRMYGEMLRDGLVASEEKRAEYYETITDESERLSRLIDNVLEFSRLEQNRRDLDLVVDGLPELVREVAEKMRAHVEREGFSLRVDLATPLPRTEYDRDAITQILFNLVDNALKYARDAERREVWIRGRVAGGHVELAVRDFGPGVPPDKQSRIFEPFYRVGDELTRTSEGTGIGLALVKELVEKMDGRIRASSPEGGGLEIVVELDLARAQAGQR